MSDDIVAERCLAYPVDGGLVGPHEFEKTRSSSGFVVLGDAFSRGAVFLGDFRRDAYRGDLIVVKSIFVDAHPGIIEVEVKGKCRIVSRFVSHKIRDG